MQLLSAGLERFRAPIVDALRELLAPDGILARNDAAVRTKEGLARATELLARRRAARDRSRASTACAISPRPGTDRRPAPFSTSARIACSPASVARGRALDCFSYHGSFALHLARKRRRASPRSTPRSPRSRARARTPRATDSPTSSSMRDRRVRISLRDAEARGDALRHDRARPARVREDARARSTPRSAATRRSTCARCACSRPAACCSPRAAASTSRAASSSRCCATPPPTAAAASRCARFAASRSIIPKC